MLYNPILFIAKKEVTLSFLVLFANVWCINQ